MDISFQTALILAPHTDDGEFGCGGTIAKLVSEGVRVVYVAFSAAEQSVRKGLPNDILRREVILATRDLGILSDDCIVLNFEVRRFPEHRQAILQSMVDLNLRYKPDVVFLPSLNDTHQDHQVIAVEGFRAFKKVTMLGYEVPWNNLNFTTTGFFELSESDLSKKCLALGRYASQSHRDYASTEFVRSLAVIRGTQVGKRYAETFQVIRLVI